MADPAPLLETNGLSTVQCQGELVALFETLVNVMFCVKDADGVYLEVNTAFVRRSGRRSKREVVGRRASDLFSPERATHYQEQDRRVLSGDGAMRDQLELIRRPHGGLGWYLSTKLPIFDTDDPTTPTGLVSVSRDLLTPTEDGVAVESLQPVVSYVRQNLTEPLRVADLASEANCSVSQLRRRVQSVFGLTPKQYVLRVKVERAMELLTETDDDLSTIASQVGFYDQPDFSRRFARITGRTPAQFRSSTSDLVGGPQTPDLEHGG